ncbi:hypothetical protein [Clostridium intestinale]|uniref:Response regulator receiver protein n=1 Tax=Clostridium intestinale URNW TaxID=1294142 RepID=U2PX75_9CLOT|nr:hypothetical protein [Clostridium intestinale]ERK28419.1 response regulator receiver protein [Clostridium intestinale URNW]
MANQAGKGPKAEYVITGLFQNQGYLTRRSIPLYYGNKNQDATDVDVLGILFTQPFQMHRVICDCKNKQKSKPYERIFWVKGLASFIEADDTYVSLPQASWDTIKFAQDGGVRVLTADVINEYFSNNSNSYGVADSNFYMEFFGKFNTESKKNKPLNKSISTLKRLYLNEDPYVSINICMEVLNDASKQLKISKESNLLDENTFWKYICCEAMVLISINILNICADTLCLPLKARREHILSKLTYGDIEPNRMNTILTYAKNVANQIIKESVPKNLIPKVDLVDFGDILPPNYSNNIIGIVERAIKNPQWYVSLPQVLDFILFEFAMKNKEFSLEKFKLFFNSGENEGKLKVAKNILTLAKNTCNLDLKLLWGTSDGFISNNNEKLESSIDSGEEKNEQLDISSINKD